MPWACRRFAEVFLAFGFSLISGEVAHSQDQSITSSISMAHPTVIPRPCRSRRPVLDTKGGRRLARETGHPDNLCDELAFDSSATASPGHGDAREKANEDPVLEELQAMGEQGLDIARAREEVLEILEGQSRCAAWFQQAEPHAARKFRSLRYTIDKSAPPLHFENTERCRGMALSAALRGQFHRRCKSRLHDHHQRQRSFLSTPIRCAHCPERWRTGRAQRFSAVAP
jgi:hypothetical protein